MPLTRESASRLQRVLARCHGESLGIARLQKPDTLRCDANALDEVIVGAHPKKGTCDRVPEGPYNPYGLQATVRAVSA